MSKFSALKGFKDLLPDEAGLWNWVESAAHETFPAFGFSFIRTPILEAADLFTRSIGETTDIVEKEMYTFEDWDGKKISLRPEGTASVVRAFLENGLSEKTPLAKFYYLGPMFRHERPQAGRLRQFHQIGAETIGSIDPRQDVELLSLLSHFFRRLEIGELTLEINSLGCPVCRPPYRSALQAYFKGRLAALCEDCRRRFDTNPLRILDCKKEECKAITREAPSPLDYLCPECGAHFKSVQEGLALLSIAYQIRPHLVRGLDYYTKTAFEMTTPKLGAQNAVAAGGRYDGLVEALGGPSTPAIGFAIGMERVIRLVDPKHAPPLKIQLFIAAIGEAASRALFPSLFTLRQRGVRSEMGEETAGLKGLMKRADRLGAEYVLIVGETELAGGKAILRNMSTKEQEEIGLSGLVDMVVSKFRK
ncbi:MAG TPA: histidine--tRNA ligase [Candidatus Manganitrophaceae bacterium]|nr:histidine--tRNA ligase [Candidatus Manganitrophaceae bacterium]